jgi:hypothetical protein
MHPYLRMEFSHEEQRFAHADTSTAQGTAPRSGGSDRPAAAPDTSRIRRTWPVIACAVIVRATIERND